MLRARFHAAAAVYTYRRRRAYADAATLFRCHYFLMPLMLICLRDAAMMMPRCRRARYAAFADGCCCHFRAALRCCCRALFAFSISIAAYAAGHGTMPDIATSRASAVAAMMR